jgi:hypothetical protein
VDAVPDILVTDITEDYITEHRVASWTLPE